MEYIPGNDRYLDPPEDPILSDCDHCGGTFRTDDLHHIRKPVSLWLCEDCTEVYDAKLVTND